jgi:hypothetical protein
MGLFDIFTGDPAKDAAAKNTALLQANQTAGTNTLQQGQTSAIGALDKSAKGFMEAGGKYGATTLGLDALGVNGPGGNDRATDAFHAGPGYQYRVDQALDQTSSGGRGGGHGRERQHAGGSFRSRRQHGKSGIRRRGLATCNGYVSPELQATAAQAARSQMRLDLYRNGEQYRQPRDQHHERRHQPEHAGGKCRDGRFWQSSGAWA